MASWGEAFAAQAEADLDAYLWLTESTLPSGQRLHFLQMWLEKFCKAQLYLIDAAPDQLQATHNLIGKVLPKLVEEYWRRIGFTGRRDGAQLKQLCREIDLLHPQVKQGGKREDNVEYPWLGRSGSIETPARYRFPLAARLHSPEGKLFLKAAIALTRNSTKTGSP